MNNHQTVTTEIMTLCKNTPLEDIRDWVMSSHLSLTWHGMGVLTFEDRHRGIVHSYHVSKVNNTHCIKISVGCNNYYVWGDVPRSKENLMQLIYLCRYLTATVCSIIRPLDIGPVINILGEKTCH